MFKPKLQIKKLPEYMYEPVPLSFYKKEKYEGRKALLLPGTTSILYPQVLKLTFETTGETVEIAKDSVIVGRRQKNASTGLFSFENADVYIENNTQVSREHATFFYEDKEWFVCDNESTNGTWLNGIPLLPGVKYQLCAGDELLFSHTEKAIFYKPEHSRRRANSSPHAALMLLEAMVDAYKRSEGREKSAYSFIVSLLADLPLIFPLKSSNVYVDSDDCMQGNNPQVQNILENNIFTVTGHDGAEYIPAFTSFEEAKLFDCRQTVRCHPLDYLAVAKKTGMAIHINPVGRTPQLIITPNILSAFPPVVKKITPPDENELFGVESLSETLWSEPVDKTRWPKPTPEIIGGKYSVIKQIDGSGYSSVYLVKDIATDRNWAMKVYSMDVYDINIGHILEEGDRMKKLCHPAVPQFRETFFDNGRQYNIMEYIPGTNLKNLIKKEGPQSAETVARWAKQLCDVLGYMHSLTPPMIYRDMKPANIILTESGNLKLVDFSISAEKRTRTTPMGTSGYAAPEQYRKDGTFDERTDIYGLGMTMHYLLAGVLPSSPSLLFTDREIAPNIPHEMSKIISKCIISHPTLRYFSCRKLAEDLDKFLDSIK